MGPWLLDRLVVQVLSVDILVRSERLVEVSCPLVVGLVPGFYLHVFVVYVSAPGPGASVLVGLGQYFLRVILFLWI